MGNLIRYEYPIDESQLREEDRVQLNDLMNSASALFKIPVFFSHPSFRRLNENQKLFVIRMYKEIKRELLLPRTLPDTEQYPETLVTNVRRIILSSYGMAAVNLKDAQTAFLQLEPSMAYQHGLPLLLVKELGIVEEGFWLPGVVPYYVVTWFSDTVSVDEFFASAEWKEIIKNWSAEVRNGYYIQTEPEFKFSCDSSR